MMKTFNEISLGKIKGQLKHLGITLTDHEFDSLSCKKLKKVYKTAKKIARLENEINAIVESATQPLPSPKK